MEKNNNLNGVVYNSENYVYDQFRTARLNIKYLEKQVE